MFPTLLTATSCFIIAFKKLKAFKKCLKDKAKEEKKYIQCVKDEEECEEDRDNCEKEQKRAQKSLEKMPSKFDKCIQKKCPISDTLSAVKMA
jgi:folate-dependent tRNA-U54 methylase TrmFO/GidA